MLQYNDMHITLMGKIMSCVLNNLILEKLLYIYINVIALIKIILAFLILTIVIATVTLIERKVLAIVQRRVGPNYIGYKGRLQFIADALKLLVKHIHVLTGVNRLLFLIVPAFILIISYLF